MKDAQIYFDWCTDAQFRLTLIRCRAAAINTKTGFFLSFHRIYIFIHPFQNQKNFQPAQLVAVKDYNFFSFRSWRNFFNGEINSAKEITFRKQNTQRNWFGLHRTFYDSFPAVHNVDNDTIRFVHWIGITTIFQLLCQQFYNKQRHSRS